MAYCIICGNTFEGEFEDPRDDFCARCKDLMEYWFKEALTDFRPVAKGETNKDLTAKDFAEAFEVYGNMKWREEYDRSKNGKKR